MIHFDLPYQNCPLCSASALEFHHTFQYKDIKLRVSVCSACGFQCMNPPLSDNSLQALYSDTYFSGDAAYTYTDERINEKQNAYVWDARLRTIRKWVSSGSLLDIGCSFGGFLAQSSRYFSPCGIEISEYAASHAQNRGIPVHIGTIDDKPYTPETFSVITMIEVIEHIKNPVQTASFCYSRLQPGGILVIQTADLNAWQARNAGNSYHYYLPGHVSYFSETNLTHLLYQTGFSHVRVYRPVDFGLLPKLRKMRPTFTQPVDYLRWCRTAWYHLQGYISFKGIPLTSSMVIYARK